MFNGKMEVYFPMFWLIKCKDFRNETCTYFVVKDTSPVCVNFFNPLRSYL